jgi:DNA recombination-dependent growth factor C
MGLLSTATSVTQYQVEGQLDEPIIDTVANGLKKQAIVDIDGDPSQQAAGWTAFKTPYEPNFEDASFLLGTDFVFSLRIDKKSIPPKLVQKQFLHQSVKRQKALKRDFLSKEEQKAIKEGVISSLNLKIPSIPNVYDVVWQYEKGVVWFFSNLKTANEHLESLFFKSFGLHLIRKIPYTMAAFDKTLNSAKLDRLNRLSSADN